MPTPEPSATESSKSTALPIAQRPWHQERLATSIYPAIREHKHSATSWLSSAQAGSPFVEIYLRKFCRFLKHWLSKLTSSCPRWQSHMGEPVLLADLLTFYRLHGNNLFQFETGDPVRVRRKLKVLESLASDLPIQLSRAGVAPSAVSIIVDPIRIANSRMKLALDGGMPWETYRVERAEFQLSYRHVTAGYRVYQAAFSSARACTAAARLL